jgi:ribose/xylose/arabinose/galactoside ABC-type transport system permease subunit
VYIVLIALIVVVSLTTENFLSADTFRGNLTQLIPVVVTGSAVTLLMVAGYLDLSVGGVMALSGIVAAWLSVNQVNTGVAIVIGVLTGALLGLLNGLLVVKLGVNAVIATLGTGLYLALGAANLVAQHYGGTVSGTMRDFRSLGTGYFGAIPIAILVMVVFVGACVFLEKLTLVGKYAVAMGSNFQGAKLAGVPVETQRILLFTLAGLASGLAGAMTASRLGVGVPSIGDGMEFSVIVAAVLGGVSLAGGRGRVLATVAGAAILTIIRSALNMHGVNTFWQLIITGCLLIAMVALDVFLRGGADRPQWMQFVKRPGRAEAAGVDPAQPAARHHDDANAVEETK